MKRKAPDNGLKYPKIKLFIYMTCIKQNSKHLAYDDHSINLHINLLSINTLLFVSNEKKNQEKPKV